jgi:YD repeat-containing protein
MRVIQFLGILLLCYASDLMAQATYTLQVGPAQVLTHRVQTIDVTTYQVSLAGEDHHRSHELYQYDLRGHLVSKRVYDSEGDGTFTLETDFDLHDQRTFRSMASSHGSSSVQWKLTYDDQQRLIAEQDDALGLLRRYRYDEGGRVIAILTSYDVESDPFSVERFTYNSQGLVLVHQHRSELMVETTRISYDAQGRRSQVIHRTQYHVAGEAGKYSCQRFAYDENGRLRHLDTFDQQGRRLKRLVHRYDKAGQLVARQCGAHELVYLYDDAGRIHEQQRLHRGTLVARQVYQYQSWDTVPLAGR